MQKQTNLQNPAYEIEAENLAPVEQVQAVEVENEIEFTVLDTSFTYGEPRIN